MTNSRLISRREALTIGGLAALPSLGQFAYSNVIGANDRLRVGVIGTGVRGKYLIGNLPDSARVHAICDCATENMTATLKPDREFKKVLAGFEERDATHCTTYQDYRQMLDREKLDAVIIATPDHHHAQAAMLALDAGLDVYLEKPLTVTIQEGRLLANKVKKTKKVLQVGSQQRTMDINRFACEYIRAGKLGQVKRVDVPNYPGPVHPPKFPRTEIPEGMNWNLFIGPTPIRPYHRKLWVKDKFKVGKLLWRGWDLFRDYSGHLMTNWGAHSIDMVQYALGMDATGPVRITPILDVSINALEKDWKDHWYKKTPQPDHAFKNAMHFYPVKLEYANGTVLNLVPGVKAATFYGERGRMIITRNKYKTNPPDLIQDGPDLKIANKWNGAGHVARPHLQNWLDCIRSRKLPNAPVEVGHRTITVCHLVNIARELKRPLTWDPVEEQFPDDMKANQLLARPRRKGFELP